MSEEVTDWRQDKSPADCLRYLLFRESLSDVHFIFDHDYTSGRVPAHTFVLAMRSAVFEEELFKERAEHEDILVEDISKDIFEMMLKQVFIVWYVRFRNNITMILTNQLLAYLI